MIPQADLDAIRARAERIAGRAYNVWPGYVTCRADVSRLLDAYEEVLGLARELAATLERQPPLETTPTTWAYMSRCSYLLANSRAAGLLEAVS